MGTGLGLAGIAAGLAGAKEVVMTDREPRALYCTLCAAAANGLNIAPLPDNVVAPDEDGIPLPSEVLPVFFGTGPPPTGPTGTASVALLDWFEPDFAPFGGEGFDVVLACDVLYTPEAVDVIAPLVVNLFEGGRDEETQTACGRESACSRRGCAHCRGRGGSKAVGITCQAGDRCTQSRGGRAAVRRAISPEGAGRIECCSNRGSPFFKKFRVRKHRSAPAIR